jgi:hypothetical protein
MAYEKGLNWRYLDVIWKDHENIDRKHHIFRIRFGDLSAIYWSSFRSCGLDQRSFQYYHNPILGVSSVGGIAIVIFLDYLLFQLVKRIFRIRVEDIIVID